MHKTNGNYKNIDEERILSIKQEYSVQYFISENKNLIFEKVYERSKKVIYKI